MAADVCLPGVAEQKVEIFCLPGFVEDRRQMCFSRGSPSCFFLHMRVLREEGNRGGKRSKDWKATEEGRGAKIGRQQKREEEQRLEGNRGGKRSKKENNNDRHPTLGLFFHSSYDSSTSSFN